MSIIGNIIRSKFSRLTVFVEDVNDLPAPVGNVITLEAGVSYKFNDGLDLEGNRLVCDGAVSIRGSSIFTSTLISTGLPTGEPMISSAFDLEILGFEIQSPTDAICVRFDDPTNTQALDIRNVNLTGGKALELLDGGNCLIDNFGLFGNDGITVDGSWNTIAISNSLFNSLTNTTYIGIDVLATATINRRIRINNSAFVITEVGAIGINVEDGVASFGSNSFFLDTINFSGGGTYLSGINENSDQAVFDKCIGIQNTTLAANYYMQNNATATTIGVVGTYVKAAGTTTVGDVSSKFTLTNNRATFDSSTTQLFNIQVKSTLTSGIDDDLGIRIAKNGVTRARSEGNANTGGAGDPVNLSIQDALDLSIGDYIEVFVTNNSAAVNITVQDLNVLITPIR